MAGERRRLLFVLEHFHPHVGGVETLFGELTAGLAARDHEVTVLTSAIAGAAREELWRGVRIIRERVPQSGARYFFTLKAIPRVVGLAGRADAIHTTTYNAAIPAWIGGRLRRRPVILTVHEVYADQWNRLPGVHRVAAFGYRAFEWLVLHLPFVAYHCDSDFTRRRLHEKMGVDPGRTAVVYPAVDYSFWDRPHEPDAVRASLALPGDSVVFCCFGRPGVAKGLEYLVDAMAEVRRRAPRARLVMIVSHDPPGQYKRLRARIASLGLEDVIVVLDPVERERLPRILAGVDLVVVPSVSEGFGYAAVEAAIVGKPVITTSGHSVSEVLPGAVFVPPQDASALADAMVAAVSVTPSVPTPARRYEVGDQVEATVAAYERDLSRA